MTRSDIIASVATLIGWIFEENLNELVTRIAAYTGYRCDDLDDDAFVGALDDTDADDTDSWFEYPIMGDPPVTVALARSNGPIEVRISGALDPVLTARFETLMDVY